MTTAFLAVLRRDLFVTWRELPTFLAQVVLQPLFLVFVFGRVLTSLGYATQDYADLLLPGVIALTAVLTALQGTALPLVIDFSYTKEIEDRLLAPLPTSLVAIEKVVFSTLRALTAALLMFPIGWLVLGSVVQPASINLVFALVLTPLLFTGASQYPWPSLSVLRWFQIVTLFNPLTYASEGMRAALVPEVPHMAPWISVLALIASVLLFTFIGVRGFLRRAID
jgi:ABC-2 type transport system permease protein